MDPRQSTTTISVQAVESQEVPNGGGTGEIHPSAYPANDCISPTSSWTSTTLTSDSALSDLEKAKLSHAEVYPFPPTPRPADERDDGAPCAAPPPPDTRVSSSLSPAPDGGARAWMTVAGSFCTITAGFGLINSVGLLKAHVEAHQLAGLPYSGAAVAWIPGVQACLCLGLGAHAGPLFDAHGPRWLMLGGSVGYVAGLVGMGLLDGGADGGTEGGAPARACATFWLLLLTWGVLCGLAAAVLCTVAVAVLAHWFDRRRGLAAGLAYVGSGLGGIVFPLLLRAALAPLGWRAAVWAAAAVAAVLLALGNLLIRGRLPGRSGASSAGVGVGAVDLGAFRNRTFVWTALGVCLFEFVFVGALGMLPTWALKVGFAEGVTYDAVVILNGGSAAGRLCAGVVSDRWGRFNTAILSLLFSVLVTFGMWTAVGRRVWMLYLFSPVFGFGTGTVIALAPVCCGQLCRADEFGKYWGTMETVVAVGALTCIPVGDYILDGAGTQGFVLIMGGLLVVTLGLFLKARHAFLGYKWDWHTTV